MCLEGARDVLGRHFQRWSGRCFRNCGTPGRSFKRCFRRAPQVADRIAPPGVCRESVSRLCLPMSYDYASYGTMEAIF